MKTQFLCKNHPYSCVIEKGLHRKMHRREVGCAIIFKREKSYTPGSLAALASNSAANARQQPPPTRPAMPASTRRRRAFQAAALTACPPFEPKTLSPRDYRKRRSSISHRRRIYFDQEAVSAVNISPSTGQRRSGVSIEEASYGKSYSHDRESRHCNSHGYP